MTRINSNLDPKLLKRAHLIAEWREMPMVPAALRRSLRTKTPEQIIQSIPKNFTLNTGHVKFFYNKLTFLKTRFNLIADEMERRGYTPDRSRANAFENFDKIWYGTWTPTASDDVIIVNRINQRIAEKPHLYKD